MESVRRTLKKKLNHVQLLCKVPFSVHLLSHALLLLARIDGNTGRHGGAAVSIAVSQQKGCRFDSPVTGLHIRQTVSYL